MDDAMLNWAQPLSQLEAFFEGWIDGIMKLQQFSCCGILNTLAPMLRTALLASLALLPLLPTKALARDLSLSTLAEQSEFRKTGRYDEMVALCEAFAHRWPQQARCFDFGISPEGRAMKALAVSNRGLLTPQSARAADVPVVLVQGGIHAGEIDGKDAVFWLLRQLLEDENTRRVLDEQVLLFVPVFNVDGHEQFRAWQRPNQRGPEETGFRTTAQRYNLNRDYVKADSIEMQAMLQLVNEWDPLIMMDLHATNGAQFQHDIALIAEPVKSGDLALREIGRTLRDAILDDLRKHGSRPLPFYPSFDEHDNPASGISAGVPTARYSHGYFVLRNRLGLLVETHSWRSYPERVRATRHTVESLLQQTARHGRQWLHEAHQADQRARQMTGQPIPLAWQVLPDAVRHIEFQGYAWQRTPSDVSGALMTRYDESHPEVWSMPLRDEVRPSLQENVPAAGYLIPVAWAAVLAPHLDRHGIHYQRIDHAIETFSAEVFRATRVQPAAQSMEGRQRMQLAGQWQPEVRNEAAGALFVPSAQPKIRLLMQILEPLAPDSFASWGGMNTVFERKEYMEDYVAEEQARRMLAASPALKREFEARLQSDPEFAASSQARLEFFYRRHPAWDENLDRYPVLRLQHLPADISPLASEQP